MFVTRRNAIACGLAFSASPAGLAQATDARLSGELEPSRDSLVPVRCGDLEFSFDEKLAFVRYLRWNGVEAIRGIYAAVRDQVWGTVTPRVTQVAYRKEAGSFQIRFAVECKQGDIDFVWQGAVEGTPTNLRFDFKGEARSTFLRNRIGFCVLHPLAGCAGKPCRVQTADGKAADGVFPEWIAPHQPFKDLTAISHSLMPGVTAEVRFTGDLFEMEDHRNWTDGNFKTYCTPLAKPFPVEVKKGTLVEQSIDVRFVGAPTSTATGSSRRPSGTSLVLAFPADSPARPFPEIGTSLAQDAPQLTLPEAARLRGAFRHLRVDLRLDQPAHTVLLDRAIAEASALGCKLEVAVFVTDAADEQLAQLAALARTRRLPIARWLIFHVNETSTQDKWIQLARKHLKGPIGSGTNVYFTELNRERPNPASLDLACYSINPQVHAFDNLSLVENLAAQGDTVRSARQFLSGKPIAVSPVTLKPRFNPQAKVQPSVPPGTLPSRVDRRQMSLFGAAWTLGSLAGLAAAGAASITYYETHGWAGLMELAQGAPLPDLFPSAKGAMFPLGHVLLDVAGATAIIPAAPTIGVPQIAGMLLTHPKGRTLLFANLTDRYQSVRIEGLTAPAWNVRLLDEHSFETAGSQPDAFRERVDYVLRPRTARLELALGPWATARLVSA